jgi:exosome complex RNA-binding protein Csl4
LSVENWDVKEIFTGIVRAQDIRTSEIDSVELHRCFRPRDIIRARVLSLGDSRAYYLSTAEPELGVVSSVSQNGNKMVPLDESAMHSVETGEREERKVAILSAKDTI